MKFSSRTEPLDRGLSGTSKTIDRMHALAQQGKLDPTVQKIATWIRLQVPEDRRGATRETAVAIFNWVKRHGIFQRDPFQVEQLTSLLAAMAPVIEAREAGAYSGPALFQGDCDTYAVFVAALGGVLGFQYAFETAKVDSRRPDEFSHVWGALLVGRDWLALDASTHDADAGWRPPVPEDRFKRWPEQAVNEVPSMSGMNGMGDWPEQRGRYVSGDYYGYGVPKFYYGNGHVPRVDAGRVDLLVPHTPAVPRGEMEPGITELTEKVPDAPPDSREQMSDDSFFPRPHYEGQKPYYHTRTPYPPGWPFARQVEVEFPTGESAIQQGDSKIVVVNPEVIVDGGYGGMGALPIGGALVSVAPTAPVQQAAATDIWGSITGAIGGLVSSVPKLAEAGIDKLKARYADALNKATQRVTGQAGGVPTDVSIPGYTEPRPLWKNPMVVLGGLAVAGVATAFVIKSRGGDGRRRRR